MVCYANNKWLPVDRGPILNTPISNSGLRLALTENAEKLDQLYLDGVGVTFKHNEGTARLHHAAQLGQGRFPVGDVHQDGSTVNEVKRAVREG